MVPITKLIATILAVVLASLLAGASGGAELFIDPGQSSAEFLAIGRPSMMKIKGKGAKVSGNLKINKSSVTGEMKVDLDQFDTGITTRTHHMKEKYLQIEKPENRYAFLVLTKIDGAGLLASSTGEKKSLPFESSLFLHGVHKNINGTADISWKNQSFEGLSVFKIKLSDFNISIPTFAGVTVAEDVDIEVRFKGKINTAVQ